MNNFIEALENNQHDVALKILKETPSLSSQKTEDGWDILQLASYYNSPSVVNYFLENEDFNKINGAKVHPLLIALEESNKEVIESFLNFSDSNKINWNIKDKSGNNLSYLSLFYGFNDFVDPLIKKNISFFENNNQGLNAFSLIIEKGNLELFDKIYENNNLQDFYNEIFIKKSIQYDFVDIFERLQPYSKLDADELFNLASGFNSVKTMSAIMESGEVIPGMEQVTKIVDLMCRNYENEDEKIAAQNLAEYLFEIKVPFSRFVNEQGQSAWMLCIQNNNEEVFDKLMNSNENVNIADKEQHSPLFYAIEKNNNHFVKVLLKKKSNPNQLDKQKNTPLIKAVEKGNLEMVKDILKYCQLINETNKQNEHALSIAIKKRRMDIVTELIWAGGEITTNPVKFVEEKHLFHFGSSGESERFAYHDEEHIDNFVALSKLGFRLDQTNENGDSFLLHFIKNGYMSNFTAMLRCQFNPNQIDNEGNSALMCSANKKQNEYFNAILKKFHNVDLEQTNEQGENVYDICLKHGKVKRIEQLISYDENLSLINATKAAKIIAKDGNLEEFTPKLLKSGLDLSFVDEYKNNLLMFSLVGGNLNNFKYLVETIGIPVDVKHKNTMGHSIEDMINAMPPEVAKDFNIYINKSVKKNLK